MMRELWMRFTPGRYVAALEAEVTRLRAENRALLNSILGIAGVPPVSVPEDFAGRTQQARTGEEKSQFVPNIPPTRQNTRTIQASAPMRRRSWQQINRALELDSAKKKEQISEGIALPVARKE